MPFGFVQANPLNVGENGAFLSHFALSMKKYYLVCLSEVFRKLNIDRIIIHKQLPFYHSHAKRHTISIIRYIRFFILTVFRFELIIPFYKTSFLVGTYMKAKVLNEWLLYFSIGHYTNFIVGMDLPGIVLSRKQPINPARNILVLRRTVMTWLNSWLEVFTSNWLDSIHCGNAWNNNFTKHP